MGLSPWDPIIPRRAIASKSLNLKLKDLWASQTASRKEPTCQ